MMIDNLFSSNNRSPQYSQETIDILRLTRSQNIGPKTFIQLVNLFGSAKNALDNIEDFSIKGGRSKPIKVFSKDSAEKEIEKLSKERAYLLTYKDFNYSQLLLQIHDFPPVISYKGNISLLNSEKIIAIVGARNSSINAKSFTSSLSAELINEGYVTVSGLARGIDAAVHHASKSQTIAVIAGGIDHIYPPENKKLYERIINESLLIAELPIGSKPLSQHFPQRNRIISGLSLATIVIEASLKSGSLITANFAIEQNREVFAVPGFPLDPRCIGSNKLIKNGAYLLESSEDVISNISTYQNTRKILQESKIAESNFQKISKTAISNITDSNRQEVKSLLSSTPISYESIAQEINLPLSIIYTICLELELAGKITRHAGNRISLIY